MPDTAVTEIDFGGATQPMEPRADLPATVIEPAAVPQAIAGDPILLMIERAARDRSVDIDKMDRLLAMKERLDARQAQVDYDNAMADAQKKMQPIRANMENPQTKSEYADQAALDRVIRPIYTEHGFSLSYSMGDGAPAGEVRLVCTVAHRGGHREHPYIDMPADGKGARGGDVMTKTHATGAAATYGKRYLLGMIFNLAIARDDDGNGASSGSWGAGGKEGAIDEAERDGLMRNAPKITVARRHQLEKQAGTAVEMLNMGSYGVDSLHQWNEANKAKRERMEADAPDLAAKVAQAYTNALQAAEAREGLR